MLGEVRSAVHDWPLILDRLTLAGQELAQQPDTLATPLAGRAGCTG